MKPYVVGACKISGVSRAELKKMRDNAIKIWHFEKTDNGVKPVKGEYDPINPNHVRKNKVIRQQFGVKFKE